MFTGIIQSQGKISQMTESNKFKSIEIESNLKNFDIGSSICCSGICLTATSKKKINLLQIYPMKHLKKLILNIGKKVLK